MPPALSVRHPRDDQKASHIPSVAPRSRLLRHARPRAQDGHQRPEQKMIVYRGDVPIAEYAVSTSKFGVGDGRGSCATPLGKLEVAKKIGANAAIGAVFKSRHPTGEVLRPDVPGRDPIVTCILWLNGLESRNAHAYARCIYIHGTPRSATSAARRATAASACVPATSPSFTTPLASARKWTSSTLRSSQPSRRPRPADNRRAFHPASHAARSAASGARQRWGSSPSTSSTSSAARDAEAAGIFKRAAPACLNEREVIFLVRPVDFVSDDGMADVREMHANLVRAASHRARARG